MIAEGGGMWRCVACGIIKRKNDMRRHVVANHLENTSVECELCGKRFKNKDSMRKHACALY